MPLLEISVPAIILSNTPQVFFFMMCNVKFNVIFESSANVHWFWGRLKRTNYTIKDLPFWFQSISPHTFFPSPFCFLEVYNSPPFQVRSWSSGHHLGNLQSSESNKQDKVVAVRNVDKYKPVYKKVISDLCSLGGKIITLFKTETVSLLYYSSFFSVIHTIKVKSAYSIVFLNIILYNLFLL